jgi:hypothetical protein
LGISVDDDPIAVMTNKAKMYKRGVAKGAFVIAALACTYLAPYSDKALAQSDEVAAKAETSFWQSIDSDSVDELEIYLQRFPQGRYVAAAKQRIALIERAKREAVAAAERAQLEAAKPKPREEVKRPAPPAKPYIAGRLFSVGDEIAWTVSDSLTNLATDEIRIKFDQESDGILSASRGLWKFDVFGNRIRTPSFEYDRAYTFLPKELAVGRKWSHSYQRKNSSGQFSSWSWDYEVEAMEVVKVPAGQFDTLRILGTAINREGQSLRNTFWLERNTLLPVKFQQITRRGGFFLSGTVDELKYFKPAP